MSLQRIDDLRSDCPDCGRNWGPMDCEPDVDGDGNFGCSECGEIVYFPSKEGAMASLGTVRHYGDRRAMERGVREMEKAGWERTETSQELEPRKWSCCLGFLPALLAGPKRTYSVYFARRPGE